MSFFHHYSLDSFTQVYYTVSEISHNQIFDYPLLVFSSFYTPLLVFFCQIYFSLVVVYSILIVPHINHIQYHVIMIRIFPLD